MPALFQFNSTYVTQNIPDRQCSPQPDKSWNGHNSSIISVRDMSNEEIEKVTKPEFQSMKMSFIFFEVPDDSIDNHHHQSDDNRDLN